MREKEYWQTRYTDTILWAEDSVLDYERRLLQAYEVALIEIKKDIASFFNKYADKDNKILYASIRKRLTALERADLNTLLKEWYSIAKTTGLSSEYTKYLKELGSKATITRLESLQASIQFEIEKLKTGQHKDMTELMSLNYMAAYYSNYFNLAQGLEIGVNFADIDRFSIEKAIRTRWNESNYSDRIWRDRAALIRSIEKILPRSFSQGLNVNQLGDLIAKELGVSRAKGRTLARTEINYICNQADLDIYKICGIKKYEYLATLDMRTSDICRGLDGFVGLVSQAVVDVNYPPMHCNCRSTTIPYFEDDKTDDLEERVARNENGKTIRVPRRMTQEQWIKQYVPEEQQAALLGFHTRKQPTENK